MKITVELVFPFRCLPKKYGLNTFLVSLLVLQRHFDLCWYTVRKILLKMSPIFNRIINIFTKAIFGYVSDSRYSLWL